MSSDRARRADTFGQSATSLRAGVAVSTSVLATLLLADVGYAAPAADPPASSERGAEHSASVSEVYVTARRRQERLIDVPAAINAVSATALARYDVASTNALSQTVPNLVILTTGSGAGGSIGIRGIANSTSDVGISPEVAYNIDGINLTRMRVNSLGLLDMDHVEVLEGPQALYFGKNSPAGLVSLTSVDAGSRFDGYIRGSYEFTTAAPQVDAAVTIPLNDSLSVRFAFEVEQKRGYIRNQAVALIDPFGYAPLVDPGAVNKYQDGNHQELGRFTLRYAPNNRFNADFKFTFSNYRGNADNSHEQTMCAPGVHQVRTSPSFGLAPVPDPANTHCDTHPISEEGALNATLASHYPNSNGGVPFDRTRMALGSLTMNYRVGQVMLTSITGYFDLKEALLVTNSKTSVPYLMGADQEDYYQVSEEIRAVSSFSGPLNFMAGGYYEYSRDKYTDQDYFSPKTSILGPDTRYGFINTTNLLNVTPNTTYSLFGSIDWKVVPTLELTAGARWTHETKVSTLQNLYLNNTPYNLLHAYILLPEGTVITAPTSDSNVSPEVTLTWHVQPNFNVYGAYKTGYKSGGTSNAETLGANATAKSLSFQPETSHGGEIGAKGEWLDGRLRATFDIYDYDFINLQVQSLYFSQNLAPTFQILNAAAANTKGFEFQGSFQVVPDLSIRGHLDYNKAIYTTFDNANCTIDQTTGVLGVMTPGCNAKVVAVGNRTTTTHTQNLSGRDFPRAPHWFVGGGATYTHGIGEDLRLIVDADLNYESSFVRAYGTAAYGVQPGFLLVNAAVRVAMPQRGWEFAIIGSNLSNVFVLNTMGNAPGAQPGVYTALIAPPRQVTAQLSYKF